ncbi:hypothetical protein D7V88_00620 [Corallococcus terminator]|uniref:Uncharacterized protein n=1 Tax=Corallococcus terminator TaxID=2316733 RepID=A0A3A8JFD8_9BACT|nr:hypothetical protein D7V88_00620 [Corallococcus terminator]
MFCSFFLLAPVAKAAPVALTCVGAEAAEFTPGLTNTPQQVSFEGLGVFGCAGLPLGIVSATIETVGQGTQSCLGANADSLIEIKWSDDTTSLAEGSTVVSLKPTGQNVVVLTAKIVEGRFEGATLVRTLTLLNTDPTGCFTPEGVTHVAGPATLVVTKAL